MTNLYTIYQDHLSLMHQAIRLNNQQAAMHFLSLALATKQKAKTKTIIAKTNTRRT